VEIGRSPRFILESDSERDLVKLGKKIEEEKERQETLQGGVRIEGKEPPATVGLLPPGYSMVQHGGRRMSTTTFLMSSKKQQQSNHHNHHQSHTSSYNASINTQDEGSLSLSGLRGSGVRSNVKRSQSTSVLLESRKGEVTRWFVLEKGNVIRVLNSPLSLRVPGLGIGIGQVSSLVSPKEEEEGEVEGALGKVKEGEIVQGSSSSSSSSSTSNSSKKVGKGKGKEKDDEGTLRDEEGRRGVYLEEDEMIIYETSEDEEYEDEGASDDEEDEMLWIKPSGGSVTPRMPSTISRPAATTGNTTNTTIMSHDQSTTTTTTTVSAITVHPNVDLDCDSRSSSSDSIATSTTSSSSSSSCTTSTSTSVTWTNSSKKSPESSQTEDDDDDDDDELEDFGSLEFGSPSRTESDFEATDNDKEDDTATITEAFGYMGGMSAVSGEVSTATSPSSFPTSERAVGIVAGKMLMNGHPVDRNLTTTPTQTSTARTTQAQRAPNRSPTPPSEVSVDSSRSSSLNVSLLENDGGAIGSSERVLSLEEIEEFYELLNKPSENWISVKEANGNSDTSDGEGITGTDEKDEDLERLKGLVGDLVGADGRGIGGVAVTMVTEGALKVSKISVYYSFFIFHFLMVTFWRWTIHILSSLLLGE
jgi:hypothetical protein